MRCASPPDSVSALRPSVRYSRPTSRRKRSRSNTSLRIGPAMAAGKASDASAPSPDAAPASASGSAESRRGAVRRSVMVRHYLGVVLLFLAVAVAPGGPELGRGPAAAAVEAEQLDVPPEALEALRQGRYWRASRILRGYLASTPNPRPETILLAAQAEAGWGAWARVDSLL